MTFEGASSLTRNSTAGVTVSGLISAAISGGIRPSVMPVAAVGSNVLTRMLFLAPSRCSTFISPIIAGLGGAVVRLAEIAVDAGRRGGEHRRGRSCARACPAHTALAQIAEPMRWTFSTSSKSASSILAKLLSRRMPALLTRMSTLPQRDCATADHRGDLIGVGDVGAVGDRRRRRPPRFRAATRSAASDGSPSRPRSLTTTFAPRAASPSAWQRPRPPPAPVTIATRPSNRIVMGRRRSRVRRSSRGRSAIQRRWRAWRRLRFRRSRRSAPSVRSASAARGFAA